MTTSAFHDPVHCRNGDHYGQCSGPTLSAFAMPERAPEDPRVAQARDALRYWDGANWGRVPADLLRPMAGELAAALRSLLAVTDERSKS